MPFSRTLLALCSILTLGAALPATSPSSAPATQPVTPAPVPLLSPEQEAQTFNLPEGLRAEVVASEPLVQHPVAIAFDADGRLWVCEMRNYMPDTTGWQETKPTGRISILEDTDGDGRMDKSSIFLDHLVLPRAIGFAAGGVLVGTPPNLLFCRDTNGDDQCDEQQMIATDYGVPENPENFANGLLWGLDNWMYNAGYPRRLHLAAPAPLAGRISSALQPTTQPFTFSPIPTLGQWGICHDDANRLFFNTNSDHLRASLIGPHYSSRNPTSPVSLADTQIAKDQAIFPAHPTTVNRGYRPGFLRSDGTLAAFTAACSPHIYRGDLLPADFYGNAFCCDPSANVVRRSILTEDADGIHLTARNAYDNKEFIASTYERFRPVNIQTGPDGALYIVDMHHGLIQHKMSLTQYAKENYQKKQLDKHLLTGRIFRIVPTHGMGSPMHFPQLSKASSTDLVQLLTHKNGWLRDTAQRLLVERADATTGDPLRNLALHGTDWTHRFHALWTLDGMSELDLPTLTSALGDPEPKMRAAAIRLSEPHLATGRLLADVLKLKDDPAPQVQLQVILSLSPLETLDVQAALRALLLTHAYDATFRECAISGLAHREIPFLVSIFSDPAWSERSDDRAATRAATLTDIARSITRRHQPDEMLSLATLIGSPSPSGRGQGEGASDQPAARPPLAAWQQLALLESIPDPRKDAFGQSHPISLTTRPAALDSLASSANPAIRKRTAKVEALFTWPGKPTPPHPPVRPLTAIEQQRFDQGKLVFAKTCAACHQPDGAGQEGKAPPFVGSPWIAGPDTRLIRIVLHGVRGPLTVGDHKFNLDMPALATLTDDQIGSVLTFVRRSFGHSADPVDPVKVQSIRDWTQAKKDGWTEKELLEVR